MGCTVFANDDGFFHKGSGGSGQAFPDVCLSPPPPPAGPVPVPYQNLAQASDLSAGSTTVKIDGEPTALEDASFLSTSTGDEAGTQGGNVVTHQTKGKAYFMLWSFDVKVEGKGVDRHTDPMEQNCASKPPGGLTPRAKVLAKKAAKPRKPCKRAYNKGDRHGSPTEAQKKAANAKKRGKPPRCWECKSPSPTGWIKKPTKTAPNPKKRRFVADHDPPCLIIYYSGGCNKTPAQQKKKVTAVNGVKPHCSQCSNKQGTIMRALSQNVLRVAHGV